MLLKQINAENDMVWLCHLIKFRGKDSQWKRAKGLVVTVSMTLFIEADSNLKAWKSLKQDIRNKLRYSSSDIAGWITALF